jgi:nitrogen regulatory protein P-II 1
MKKIEAVIRREKLVDVRRALVEAGFLGITVYEVLGRGRQKVLDLQFRGREYQVDLLPKTKLEMLVDDGDVEKAIEVIVKTAATGRVGDGKLDVLSVDDIVRIRTGERGEGAI